MRIKTSTITFTALLLTALLVGCTSQSLSQAADRTPTPTPCVLPTIVVPTPPAEIPGYTELDRSTGLHMTGKVPEPIDLESYHLVITGTVDHPLSLTYDDLRCMRKVELRCTLVCPGFFEDEATWAGVPLADVLERAGVQPNAGGLRLVSADGYATLATMDMVTSQQSFLAYEWEGEPLPILHGFPIRAVFPESSGSSWAKWLVEIEVLEGDFRRTPNSGSDEEGRFEPF